MKNWQRWIPVVLIMAGICWFSSIPHLTIFDTWTFSPEIQQFIKKYTYRIGGQGFFSYAFSPHPDYIVHKLGHIFGFGSLGIALFYAIGRAASLAVTLTVLFAASDELHQYFVAGRSSRLGDIVLDVVAAACFIYLLRIFRRAKQDPDRLTARDAKNER